MSRCLYELKINESAKVKSVNNNAPLYSRFIDLGILNNTVITKIGTSPLGDPSAYLIRGAVIAIRNKDCRDIKIGGLL